MRKKVIFITGTGHCGSTLLDLLLSSQSEAFSLGEFHKIRQLIRERSNTSQDFCVICGRNCDFWNKRVSLRALRIYFSNKTIPQRIRARLARFIYNPYRLFFKWSGKSVLVESSKTLWWFKRQFQPRYAVWNIDRYLIWVHRDGRAVVNSRYRESPELGIDQIVEGWMDSVARIADTFERYPKDRKLRVSYEELAFNPEKVLKDICDFVGLTYETSMLQYWAHDHHHLFGNAGTNRAIIEYRKRLKDGHRVDPDWSAKHNNYYDNQYYQDQGLAIKFDDRWKSELPKEALITFDALAGQANKPFVFNNVPSAA